MSPSNATRHTLSEARGFLKRTQHTQIGLHSLHVGVVALASHRVRVPVAIS